MSAAAATSSSPAARCRRRCSSRRCWPPTSAPARPSARPARPTSTASAAGGGTAPPASARWCWRCWIGPRIWREAATHGFLTAGDYLEHRYGPLVRGLLASLIWLGTLAILAGQLIAGAAVLTVVADIPRLARRRHRRRGDDRLLHRRRAAQLGLGQRRAAGRPAGRVHHRRAAGDQRRRGRRRHRRHARRCPATYWDPIHSTGPGSGYAFLALLGPAFVISPGLLQKAYGGASARAVRLGIGAAGVAQLFFAFIPLALGIAARHLHPDLPTATWSCRRCSPSRCRWLVGIGGAGGGVQRRGQHLRRDPVHAVDLALPGSLQAVRQSAGQRCAGAARGASGRAPRRPGRGAAGGAVRPT